MMNFFSGVWNASCPKCKTGKIFINNGSIFRLKAPVMSTHCSHCNHRFEKEPGFFIGAMYVSYGLTILELMPLFFICVSFLAMGWVFLVLFLFLIATMFFNFRLSRIIWIHLFGA